MKADIEWMLREGLLALPDWPPPCPYTGAHAVGCLNASQLRAKGIEPRWGIGWMLRDHYDPGSLPDPTPWRHLPCPTQTP